MWRPNYTLAVSESGHRSSWGWIITPADVFFKVTEMLLHRACHCIDVSELTQPALSMEDVPVEFSKSWKRSKLWTHSLSFFVLCFFWRRTTLVWGIVVGIWISGFWWRVTKKYLQLNGHGEIHEHLRTFLNEAFGLVIGDCQAWFSN